MPPSRHDTAELGNKVILQEFFINFETLLLEMEQTCKTFAC